MRFTTIGITAIDLLLADDVHLQKLYSLVSNLDLRDIEMLILCLKLIDDAMKKLDVVIDVSSEDYKRLLEDLQDFKKDFLKTNTVMAKDSDINSIDALFTSGTNEFSDNLVLMLEGITDELITNLSDDEVLLSIVNSESWRANIKLSEDITIVERRLQSLKERYKSLPVEYNGDIFDRSEHLGYLEKLILDELRKNLYKIDTIIYNLRVSSNSTSDVLNIPNYADYYSSRAIVFKLTDSIYATASEKDCDFAISSINKFLSSEDYHYDTSNYDEDLLFDVRSFYPSKTRSIVVLGNKAVMSTLNSFYVLLKEMQTNTFYLKLNSIIRTLSPEPEIAEIRGSALIGQLGKNLAQKFDILGLIPKSKKVLVKCAYSIYKTKGKRRRLSLEEKEVFHYIKMAIISAKYGFGR